MAHHFPIPRAAGSQYETRSFTDKLTTIPITHPAATAKGPDRISVHPFYICDAQLLALSENEVTQKRNQTASNQHLSVKCDAIANGQRRHQTPGNKNDDQSPAFATRPQKQCGEKCHDTRQRKISPGRDSNCREIVSLSGLLPCPRNLGEGLQDLDLFSFVHWFDSGLFRLERTRNGNFKGKTPACSSGLSVT